MARGVASKFKWRCTDEEGLKTQSVEVGKNCHIRCQRGLELRDIYCLVTKVLSYQKTHYKDLWRALWELRKKTYARGIKKLSLSKIGCGLDRLNWRVVQKTIEVVFRDTGVESLVCSWNPERPTPWRKTFDCHFFTNDVCTRGWQAMTTSGGGSVASRNKDDTVTRRNDLKEGAV